MASTYTTSLKIQQIGNGEQAGTWGSTTNTNWTLMEQAVAGVQTITMANANYTLSNLNGTLDEARNAVLVIAGTNSGVYQVVAPLTTKTYIVSNQTTGGYAITIGGASGSLITIPNGLTTLVYCDGTNFYSGITGLTGNQTISGNLTVTGNGSFGGTLGVTGTLTGAAINGTTITASSQFSGPGTGLTGTASSLSIGGSAASATTATNATNAANLVTSNFTIQESGGKLIFKYGSTTIASLDSSGNFTALGNTVAGGTP
jgi:hypothetical protein